MTPAVSRRIVFQGFASLGVAAALAGCGGGSSEGESGPAAGAALATTDEIPIGGGLVLADENIVITQPTAGDFRAYQARCTHQGSPIARVGDDGMECDLHGSRFDIADGSATQGPATESLAQVSILVEGDQILAA